jgi:type II secretory ATPase GspE/PulE/Tfp pilus assembly ATPase PilB-like protein
MTCEEARDELIAYTRGELNEERTKAVEEHLARCAGCTRELEGAREVMAMAQAADETAVADMADAILRAAIQRRASDIHLEMTGDGPRVRLRIDGVIYPGPPLTRPQYEPLVTRFKLMAEQKLSIRNVPQDGRFRITEGGRDLDVRVSTVPYVPGEGVVMRLIDRASVLIGLEKLGLSLRMLEQVQEWIALPSGLLITTGPTGAGKTTFLYSVLSRLNRPEVKIMTVEDPVELLLSGVNQLAVHRRAGVTHATAMRAFMRQDPDILMPSEIRDLETAEMCAQAALTGHLVLTALHTRDATEAVQRMLDIGVAPFVVAGTLIGVIGQRLVRRVCAACRESYTPEAETVEKLGFTPDSRPAAFTRGAGCAACEGIGYRGRTGLFETLIITEEIAQRIVDRAPEAALRAQALADGALIPFQDDARAKIADGTTTVEEIARQLVGVVPAAR